MDREIKFRAYDEENKLMVYDFDNNTPKIYELRLGDSIHNLVYTIGLCYGTLMQYTGLKDKNGVEIYEGDLVKFYHKGNFVVCEIIWNKIGAWTLKWQDGYINNYYLSPENLEITGNIYENPELLKSK